MRNQLAAIELKMLVGELKRLEGCWLDQVYDLAAAQATAAATAKVGKGLGKGLVLQFSTSEGKSFIVCSAPSAAFMSSRKPATAESPGSFCSLLRHHLSNAKLVSISQPGSERILELVFSSRSKQQLRLVFELFSKGNIIVVDDKNVVVGAAEHQSWKDRTVRPGFKYALPPATADFANISAEELTKLVLSSGKDSVVKALAVDLGLSGSYSEEVCAAAAVAKEKKPQQLSQTELGKIYSSLQRLLVRKPQPLAVLDDKGAVAEAFPFKVAAAAEVKTKPFQTFNEAIEAVVMKQLESAASSSATAPFERKVKELEIAIGQQKAAVADMAKAVEENTRVAEIIYEHYQDVKRILDDYNTLRKTFTPEQLREYFSSSKMVKGIDEKTGTITVEIEDKDKGA